MCKEYDCSATTIIHWHWESFMRPHPLQPTKLMLTHVATTRENQDAGQPYTTNKDTIVNFLVLTFECVPDVTIDPKQGSMIDWVKEVNSKKYLKSLIQFLLKSTEEIPQNQLTKDVIKFL